MQVVCWHLVRAKASCQVSVAYSMNKVLASVKSVVLDDKVNLEDVSECSTFRRNILATMLKCGL